MWFLLSLVALSMLVARRSTEKHVAGNINNMALAWLQQAFALPIIIGTLFFARFYWPSELSSSFWTTLALYVFLISIDIYCYFKALSLADVSYVAPLMTLVAIGNIVGAYFILGQVPTFFGVLGAVLIVLGAAITYSAKRNEKLNKQNNKIALALIVLIVCVRGINASIEVPMIKATNPTTFNFYSSVLSVPLIFLASILIIYSNRNSKYASYWKKLKLDVSKHQWLLLFIGITYTINMLATYQAKLVGPNAGYVGAIKSASVLPMVLVGVLLFKEKIVRIQWVGLAVILTGLVFLAFN